MIVKDAPYHYHFHHSSAVPSRIYKIHMNPLLHEEAYHYNKCHRSLHVVK